MKPAPVPVKSAPLPPATQKSWGQAHNQGAKGLDSSIPKEPKTKAPDTSRDLYDVVPFEEEISVSEPSSAPKINKAKTTSTKSQPGDLYELPPVEV